MEKSVSKFFGPKITLVSFIGAPGCGKGTTITGLGNELSSGEKIISISTSGLIKEKGEKDPAFKKMSDEITSRGGLISDDVVFELISKKIGAIISKYSQSSEDLIIILDGCPRTIPQLHKLLELLVEKSIISGYKILHFNISEDVLEVRRKSRIIDSLKKANLCPGREEMIARNSSSENDLRNFLSQYGFSYGTIEDIIESIRPDDFEDTFKYRQINYNEKTNPIISWIDTCRNITKITICNIDADLSEEMVNRQVSKKLTR